jgi:hypothetical protein
MVIRNVVPASIAGNAVHEIAAFAGADLRDSTAAHSGYQSMHRETISTFSIRG